MRSCGSLRGGECVVREFTLLLSDRLTQYAAIAIAMRKTTKVTISMTVSNTRCEPLREFSLYEPCSGGISDSRIERKCGSYVEGKGLTDQSHRLMAHQVRTSRKTCEHSAKFVRLSLCTDGLTMIAISAKTRRGISQSSNSKVKDRQVSNARERMRIQLRPATFR